MFHKEYENIKYVHIKNKQDYIITIRDSFKLPLQFNNRKIYFTDSKTFNKIVLSR